MCRNCLNKCDYRRSSCDRRCYRNYCCDNRCDDFLWPMMLCMIRDMTRNCRCNFVDKYDRYRC